MAGLKAGFGRLATINEAFEVLFGHLPSTASEKISLDDALQRVVSSDVVSEIDVPDFVKAAMDGYALRASDTFGASDQNPAILEVVGAVSPGASTNRPVRAGCAIEIGTGSAMPPESDSVVMVEFSEPGANGSVKIRKAVAPGENTIARGSDISAGIAVVKAGTVLRPRHLGALAAIGRARVDVFRRPVVALLSTGPELAPLGEKLTPGKVFDINRQTLRAALQEDGCEILDLGIVADDAPALRSAVAKGLDEADFVLLSGGSSLGAADLVVEVFESLGRVLVHGVAVKPGKPLVLGLGKNPIEGSSPAEKMMIGLPGYPMSALSDYYIFVQAYLRKALGAISPAPYAEATLARKQPSAIGRYEFLPVKLIDGDAHPITTGSSSISAVASADGFIEIDENTEVVQQGERVRVRLF